MVVFLFRANVRGGSERIDGPVLEGIGLALWIAGLALAVWARLYIGRNWGMPMTRRQEPDLVTTGPYRFIRHPIYTGIILAMVGTALAISLFGLIVVAVIAAFFAYSASTGGALPRGGVPGHLPGLQGQDEDAHPLRLLALWVSDYF